MKDRRIISRRLNAGKGDHSILEVFIFITCTGLQSGYTIEGTLKNTVFANSGLE